VLLVGPVAATTEVEEDIDGEPPGGCCWRVWQRPTSKLKETSMALPLEGATGGSNSNHD
jgi:hypothetical protein